MKKIAFFVLMTGVATLWSCQNNAASLTANAAQSETLCGADKDVHGCIGSAGYVYSELLQDCVRPWETGTALLPPDSDAATYQKEYHIVFSPDSAQAEILGMGILQRASKTQWQSSNGKIKVLLEADQLKMMEE